ncbi:MAG: NADH-quinone oxidoreductase subunit M [Spirochaetes bacterium]|nr:NADH-quinone oxidoreductase subunit M [Spirochaetota bacterium]
MNLDSLLLTLVWTLPFAVVGLSLLIPKGNELWVKRLHALGSGLGVLIAAWLTYRLYGRLMVDGAPMGADLRLYAVTRIDWLPSLGISFFTGVDGLSMLLVLLTAIIVFTGVLASWNTGTQVKEFFALLQLLGAGVFGVFISFDLFTFFLFYEMEAVAMYLLIGVWGSGRREYGAMKLTLTLMLGSALVLVGILALWASSGLGTFDLTQLATVRFSPGLQAWVFPVLFVGFAVSAALFPFHTWSPDGHSAAPTAVSMLAAGVMMKLGAYGALRVAMYLCPEGARQWFPVLLYLISFNVVLGAFIAIRHKDLKFITAYSSISHLGLVLLGLAAGTYLGVKGASLQMISHGFLTGLFFAVIGMIYSRTHTRLVDTQSGLMKVMPFLGVAFVIAGFTGLGLPGLSGFVAEATIFIGAFQNPDPQVRILTVLAVLGITTTAVYVVRTANFILHGPFRVDDGHGHVMEKPETSGLTDASGVEKLALTLLIACILGMGLFPGWISRMLDTSLLPMFRALSR